MRVWEFRQLDRRITRQSDNSSVWHLDGSDNPKAACYVQVSNGMTSRLLNRLSMPSDVSNIVLVIHPICLGTPLKLSPLKKHQWRLVKQSSCLMTCRANNLTRRVVRVRLSNCPPEEICPTSASRVPIQLSFCVASSVRNFIKLHRPNERAHF